MKVEKIIKRDYYRLNICRSDQNTSFVEITISSPNYITNLVVSLIKIAISNFILRYLMKNYVTQYSYDYKWQLLFLLSAVLFFKNPVIEKITIIKNYGLQITNYDGLIILPHNINEKLFSKNEFIAREDIIDIIINEAFYKWFQVLFYLCIIIKDTKELKLMFPGHIKLLLEDQKTIYNVSRNYLFSEEDLRRMKLKNKLKNVVNLEESAK